MRLTLFFLLLGAPLAAAVPRTLSFNSAPQYFNVGPTRYAIDDAGDTIAVWSVFNGSNTVLQFAFKPVGGDWQTPGDPRNQANVISYLYSSVIDWTMAMDREGNTVVIWRVNNGSITVVQAVYRPVNGTFSAAGDPRLPQNFLNHYLYGIGTLPQVGIGAGHVTILWTVNNGYNNVIQASLKAPGGPFSQPGIPSDANNILNYLWFRPGQFNITTTPILFVDKEGNAIVAWQINNKIDGGSNLVVQAVTRNAGSAFVVGNNEARNPQLQANILSPRIYSISSLESALIGSGNSVVYWKRVDQVTRNLILQAAYKPKNGVWGKPEQT